MLDRRSMYLAVAFAAVLVAAGFLILLAVAVTRRARGRPVGTSLANLVAFTGGASLGTLLLIGAGPLTRPTIMGAVVLLSVERWRSGHRAQAGWLLAGVALPWTLLWGFYVAAMLFGGQPFEPTFTWVSFLAGVVMTGTALAIALRSDRARSTGEPTMPRPEAPVDAGAPPVPRASPGFVASHDATASVGRARPRTFGLIAAAIRDASAIGPFGTPELAALGALVVSWALVDVALPLSGLPISRLPFANLVIAVVLGSVVATEAYTLGMSRRGRLAYEAFSWAGEWELARVKTLTGSGFPTTRLKASRWLARRPERPEEAAIRTEVLLVAGRIDEARALAHRMPTATPVQRFERAAALDIVEWRAGRDTDLAELQAAAAEILPPDSDDRLRAEVAIATAKVRRRMSDGRAEPGDAIEPLLEVRTRLGSRADGQAGRALRKRLLPQFLVFGFVFAGLFEVFARS